MPVNYTQHTWVVCLSQAAAAWLHTSLSLLMLCLSMPDIKHTFIEHLLRLVSSAMPLPLPPPCVACCAVAAHYTSTHLWADLVSMQQGLPC